MHYNTEPSLRYKRIIILSLVFRVAVAKPSLSRFQDCDSVVPPYLPAKHVLILVETKTLTARLTVSRAVSRTIDIYARTNQADYR